jgi:hypothetical protein
VISTFQAGLLSTKSVELIFYFMTDSTKQPLLTLGDKQYAIDALNDQTKDLVQGLKVTDAQLRMTQDQLNVMKVARQALLDQLQEALKDVQPVSG